MKITNIEWEIDMDEVFEKLDDITIEDASEVLEIPLKTYANMSTSERHDFAFGFFHHNVGALYDFLLLPENEEIKIEIEEEDVADYLSDAYGYCIKSLSIEK